MSNPTPQKPSKVTITVSEHGFDALVESFESITTLSPETKAFIERRKRERREKKEREAREQGTTPPPDSPAA